MGKKMVNDRDFPPGVGRDLNANGEERALNQPNKAIRAGDARSGSSKREVGYDLHPHVGDHGEAQRRGLPRVADDDVLPLNSETGEE